MDQLFFIRALTRNQTRNLLVRGVALQPPVSRGVVLCSFLSVPGPHAEQQLTWPLGSNRVGALS